MFSAGSGAGLIGITTRWIDETGQYADLGAKLGRLGEDVSDFAIHTMGWIRCTTIGTFEEFAFDTRSVSLASVEWLLDYLTSRPVIELDTRLRCIEVTTAFGTTKISDDRPNRLVSLVMKCMEIADPGAPRDSIRRGRMKLSALPAIGDDLATRLIAIWRECGGVLRQPISELLSDSDRERSIKILVPHGDTFRFLHYNGSPNAPWHRAVWRGFEGGIIENVVPDRGMAESVKASTRSALDAGEPLVERCEGVVLSSDGLKEFEWYRISIPVTMPRRNPSEPERGVITLLSPVPRVRRAA